MRDFEFSVIFEFFLHRAGDENLLIYGLNSTVRRKKKHSNG